MFHLRTFVILLAFSCQSLNAWYEEEEEPNCFTQLDETCPNENITFWLYTKNVLEGRQLWMNNLSLAGFEPRKPLKVLIHGFHGDRDSSPNILLRPLLTTLNYHVISPDFRNLAKEPCYSQAVQNAKVVGRCLAKLLTQLLNQRLVAEEDLHLIGYGLGAHIAGFAGNFLPVHYRLQHITGLNPAKPFYLSNDTSEKLDPSDANFVDVVHTDVIMLGLLEPVGHVDFYVNMGISQPNCGPTNQMSTHYCNHMRSVAYYAESIMTPSGFYGIGCPSFVSFVTGLCLPSLDTELMGFYARFGARGRYFLATNNAPPYAMGRNYWHLDHGMKGKTYINDDLIDRLFSSRH